MTILSMARLKHSREGNRRELAALEPVHRRRVDSNGFLGTNVRTVLEVRVLTFLFSLQVETYPKVLNGRSL
jgi:hypothetical protein